MPAFIVGTVTVEGLPENSTSPQVEVFAKNVGGNLKLWSMGVPASRNGSRYALPVSPGEYIVFAKFGGLTSHAETVIVAQGQSSEANLRFD
jgi:hypothetical protein